jgi:hypothetical protein
LPKWTAWYGDVASRRELILFGLNDIVPTRPFGAPGRIESCATTRLSLLRALPFSARAKEKQFA